jgi:hypothetical protein
MSEIVTTVSLSWLFLFTSFDIRQRPRKRRHRRSGSGPLSGRLLSAAIACSKGERQNPSPDEESAYRSLSQLGEVVLSPGGRDADDELQTAGIIRTRIAGDKSRDYTYTPKSVGMVGE